MNAKKLAELDLAVAKAEGLSINPDGKTVQIGYKPYRPSRDDAEAMRLLEKYELEVRKQGQEWQCLKYSTSGMHVGTSKILACEFGPTPAIAIARAVIAFMNALKGKEKP